MARLERVAAPPERGRPSLGPYVSLLFALVALPAACGGSDAAPSPFEATEAGGAGGEGGASAPGVPIPPLDPQLGGPCVDAEQCDDELDCTDDSCDAALGRCRYAPQHVRCADDVFCNGVELCEAGVGCKAGPPVSCSDNSTCTIDVCIEATRQCESRPRDADGDGDPIRNCGGGDCNDTDPTVHSGAAEVCGNQRDDDCDGTIDGDDCVEPEFDTCAEPLKVSEPGRYELSLAAAIEDFPLSCASDPTTVVRRDLVVALVVPDAATDIVVSAVGTTAVPTLGLAASCADASSELVCSPGVELAPEMGGVARTVLRGLEPGTYPLFVNGAGDGPIELEFEFREASPTPENETCGTAAPLVPDENVVALLADTELDLESSCGAAMGELVYQFELTEMSDVELSAVALDDFGAPLVSLRSADCVELASELGCRRGSPASLFARSLEPGTYFVGLGATGPTEIDLRLTVSEPSPVPPDQGCVEPPIIEPGETRTLALEASGDVVNPGCLPGSPDATYALPLEEASDVLIVGRLSEDDIAGLSLTGTSCSSDELRACSTGDASPLRAASQAVPPGDYRVIAESALGAPMTLTVFTRPASAPTLVAFADTCEDAVTIPETGGRFLGNTANAQPDYQASCDFASSSPEGAAEQMLRLELSEARRVVFDLGESNYPTLLVVRKADGCPGTELEHACVPGYVDGRSFLDRVLPAGEYWIQIDGYDRRIGSWVLDVFVADP